jgi:hypothetical protein
MKQGLSIFLLFCYACSMASLNGNDDPSPSTKKTKEKQHLSYSGGMYAPFGLMTGFTFAKGHGFYINARCNRHVLKHTQYFFDGTSISDHTLTWVYDEKKVYSRWEANAGGIVCLYKKNNGRALKMYLGIGMLQPRYLYSFKKTAGANIEHTWVENRAIGKFTYNTELGFCFYLKESLGILVGVSALTKKHERMLTFGIGTGLYKLYH